MITTSQCFKRYGDPTLEKAMVVWDVPLSLEVGAVPKRIYCNKDLVGPLTQALQNVRVSGLGGQIKTWDGCFNIRRKKGGSTASLHAWGIAIDINAAWNGFNKKPTMSPELVKCFTDAGFSWGGAWARPDGMHFELTRFPL